MTGEGPTLQVMTLLGDLWKEVVEALQSYQLLPQLMSSLRTADRDLSSAHLWLRLITQLLAGVPLPHTPATLNTARLLADSLPCDGMDQVGVCFKYCVRLDVDYLIKSESFQTSSSSIVSFIIAYYWFYSQAFEHVVFTQVLFNKSNVHNAKHHRPITLKHASPKEAEVLQRLAKDVVESPTKFTVRYLERSVQIFELLWIFVRLNTNWDH